MATLGNIYKITNVINKKVYIGQTTKSPEFRFKRHIQNSNYFYSRSKLSKAIKKYGKNNFKLEVLCTCFSLDELNYQEQQFIKHYNSITPNGYNLNSGGKHYTRTKEITNKIVQKNKGKKRSLEQKKNISESHKIPVKVYNPITNHTIIVDSVTNIGKVCKKYGVSTRTATRKLKNKQSTKSGYFVTYLRKAG